MGYESPYGKVAGLRQRIDQHLVRLGERSTPWVGMGLIDDLRVMRQILDKKEAKPRIDTSDW